MFVDSWILVEGYVWLTKIMFWQHVTAPKKKTVPLTNGKVSIPDLQTRNPKECGWKTLEETTQNAVCVFIMFCRKKGNTENPTTKLTEKSKKHLITVKIVTGVRLCEIVKKNSYSVRSRSMITFPQIRCNRRCSHTFSFQIAGGFVYHHYEKGLFWLSDRTHLTSHPKLMQGIIRVRNKVGRGE